MTRIFALIAVMAFAACSSTSSSTTVPRAGTIGDLRTACQQGQQSACHTVRAHDDLL